MHPKQVVHPQVPVQVVVLALVLALVLAVALVQALALVLVPALAQAREMEWVRALALGRVGLGSLGGEPSPRVPTHPNVLWYWDLLLLSTTLHGRCALCVSPYRRPNMLQMHPKRVEHRLVAVAVVLQVLAQAQALAVVAVVVQALVVVAVAVLVQALVQAVAVVQVEVVVMGEALFLPL